MVSRCFLAALLLVFFSSNAQACFPQCLKRLFGGGDEGTTVEIVVRNPRHAGPPQLKRSAAGRLPLDPELQLVAPEPPRLSAAELEIRPVFDVAYPLAGQDDELFRSWLRTIGPVTGTHSDMLSYKFDRPSFGIQADLSAFSRTMSVLITAPPHNAEAYSLAARSWGYQGTESVGGLWARLRFAMGAEGVSSIRVQFGEENKADLQDYWLWNDTAGFLAAADATMSGIYIRNLYGLNATRLVEFSDDLQSYSFLFSRHDDAAARMRLPAQPAPRRVRGISQLPQNIDDMDNAYEDPQKLDRDPSENGDDDEKEEILKESSTHL